MNPLSDNFIIKILLNGIRAIFIPSEEDLNTTWEKYKEKFSFVFAIRDSIGLFEEDLSQTTPTPSLSIDVGATKYTESQSMKIIDLSWYAPYKPFGDIVITGFVYVFALWRLFVNLPGIISGSSGIIDAGYHISDIQTYQKYGFGRSSSTTLHQGHGKGGNYRK